MDPDGQSHQAVQVNVINPTSAPCDYNVWSVPNWIEQLTIHVQEPGATSTYTGAPYFAGTIGPGASVVMTIAPRGSATDSCTIERTTNLMVRTEGNAFETVGIRQSPATPPCYGRIRATPAGPNTHKPPRSGCTAQTAASGGCNVGSGVRG
jgi:hypothetical protein